MTVQAQAADLPAIFNQLDYLEKAQARLYEVATLLDTEPSSEALICVTLESITGQSQGATTLEKVTKAVQLIRDMLVRLFSSLFYAVKDLVINYRNRLESLHSKLNATQERMYELTKLGTFKGQRSGSLDHLPIASALFKSPRVTYQNLITELGSFTKYVDLAKTVATNRQTRNQQLISGLPSVKSMDGLKKLLVGHSLVSLVSQDPSKDTLNQLSLKPAKQFVKVSNSLLGNKVIAYTGYSSGAKLKDFVDTSSIDSVTPWAGSSYGYSIVEENPDFKIRDQGNTIFAILSANEIKTLLPQLKLKLGELKSIVNLIDDSATAVRKVEHQVNRLPITHLNATGRRIVKDYFSSGTKADLRFAVDMMKHLFNVLMNALLWVRISLNHYHR